MIFFTGLFDYAANKQRKVTMSETQNAPLPIPTGWKPSAKAEILAWCSNLEMQIGGTMARLNPTGGSADQLPQEIALTLAELDVELQIIAKIETLVNQA